MTASAPGKLFLLGEYAVLEGGPALLIPVTQQANVTVESGTGTVTSISDTNRTLPSIDAYNEWPLLGAIQQVLGKESLEGKNLTLDTREFFVGNQKLGLGSSAALTVALVKACEPELTDRDVYELADECHRVFQQGIGSGADIALSAMAQPIQFSRDSGPTPIGLPNDLHMLAIWTGRSASTTQLVGSMQAYRRHDPAAYKKHMTALIDAANGCIQAVSDQDSRQILARIEQYDRYLQHLSSDSRVNFYNQLHEDMRKKVKLTYKPSGAGGGDFGIAYSTDIDEITALATLLEQEQIISFVL
ncbi:MAG: hypothetical protein JJ934_11795 [Pseudomonadales bacterium]|nr:hypothetical protein [Pseudomonadales bacterium]